MIQKEDLFPYKPAKKFQKAVAYFSMEFAIDQSLKIYSGGLGFLAGSHMRSAYQLKQNLIGIGMLWKYGYYDQVRDLNGNMKVDYTRKYYSFLKDTGIVFPVEVHSAVVHVKAFLLEAETFGSAPIFLLSTDIEQNDAISRTITNRLYDANESTRVAQSIVLGVGGAKLLDLIGQKIDFYHMNEGHALPLAFYLHDKLGSLENVRKKLVFTTHTPEKAGNEERDIQLLDKMSFFYHLTKEEFCRIWGIEGNSVNYTLCALRASRISNAVSKMHGEVSRDMWSGFDNICKITHITNAQNKLYWKDDALETAASANNLKALEERKKEMKQSLFQVVADQSGKWFDPDVLTLVWARRFAGYKRANLLTLHKERFEKLLNNTEFPIQIIWAGKPYPEDYGAIETFNNLFYQTLSYKNATVLTGYELQLSALLKKGSDVWLNNPRITREASGTSGMTATMNGSVNFSIPDGWIPEFAIHGKNSFLIEPAGDDLSPDEQNELEATRMLDMLENEILPIYYKNKKKWFSIVKAGMDTVVPEFDSDRMATEYYTKLFHD